MKDINYFVLKSGTIIRKDILAINNLGVEGSNPSGSAKCIGLVQW